jgi:hypothetical protein
MKLLLTSAGISNASINDTLAGLLGKPIAESSVLFIPTAIYPFPGGAGMAAWKAICGQAGSPLCGLGWNSMGCGEVQSSLLVVGGSSSIGVSHARQQLDPGPWHGAVSASRRGGGIPGVLGLPLPC